MAPLLLTTTTTTTLAHHRHHSCSPPPPPPPLPSPPLLLTTTTCLLGEQFHDNIVCDSAQDSISPQSHRRAQSGCTARWSGRNQPPRTMPRTAQPQHHPPLDPQVRAAVRPCPGWRTCRFTYRSNGSALTPAGCSQGEWLGRAGQPPVFGQSVPERRLLQLCHYDRVVSPAQQLVHCVSVVLIAEGFLPASVH